MGVCVLPKITVKGEQVQLSGYMGYKLIGVNGYSKNKVEAHKLALWLTNEQNQLKRFETRGFGPTNKVVSSMDKVQKDPVISVVLEQAQYNRAQKGVPGNYWTPMGSLITPIITAKDVKIRKSDTWCPIFLLFNHKCNDFKGLYIKCNGVILDSKLFLRLFAEICYISLAYIKAEFNCRFCTCVLSFVHTYNDFFVIFSFLYCFNDNIFLVN